MHTVVMLPIAKIRNNSPQEVRRRGFEQLVETIRNHGVLVPIRVVKNGDDYHLIDGLRRYTAAKECGLTEIPAYIKQ